MTTDHRPELQAHGFVFELPLHLPLPEDHTIVRWLAGAPRPDGWSDGDLGRALGDVPPSPEHGPVHWLRFRSARVKVQRPLAVADLAFGDLAQAPLPRRDSRRRQRQVVNLVERAPMRRRTAVTVWSAGARGDDQEQAGRQVTAAMDILNAWLVALGVAGDKRLRPLAAGDFHPVVPWIPATCDQLGRWTYGHSIPVSLKDPADEKLNAYPADTLRRARRLFDVVADGSEFAVFYALVQRANAAQAADRAREAVTDYATAGEVFVTEIVRLAGRRKAMDDQKLQNVLTNDFAGRLGVHLGRLIGVPSDPSDPESVSYLWWMHCYTRRNLIVHEGDDTNVVLAEMARIGLVSLVVDVRDALQQDPLVADLAPLIQWGFRVDETGAGRHSHPDPLA